MPTQATLITAALHEVNAIAAGEVESAEDTAAVSARVQSFVSELAARRVTPVIDLSGNTIPHDYFPDLVRLLAEHIAPMFGRPTDLQKVAATEGRLREQYRLNSGAPLFLRSVLEFLEANGGSANAISEVMVELHAERVLADLRQRRIVDIGDVEDIAQDQFLPLMNIVAARLRPIPALLGLVERAEADLIASARLDRTEDDPLVLAVLEQLQVLGAGSAAIDATAVRDRVDQTLAELSDRNVIHLTASALPESVIPDLSRYIAAGLASPPQIQVMMLSETRLRRLAVRKTPPLEPVMADYF